MALNEAFYQVRERESQAFFGLSRAEVEASGRDDLLERFVRILTRTFRARTGRLLLLDRPPVGQLARPLYIERGQVREGLIVDPKMRGKFASYWSFPISPAALLQFAFDVRYPWLPRELTLLQAVAERCRKAIEKVNMEAEVRRLQAEAHHAEQRNADGSDVSCTMRPDNRCWRCGYNWKCWSRIPAPSCDPAWPRRASLPSTP
ncbi:MAG: hypothetical protein WDO73_06385 [Ignavibacteriota bacterium]